MRAASGSNLLHFILYLVVLFGQADCTNCTFVRVVIVLMHGMPHDGLMHHVFNHNPKRLALHE
jgi:hypothetical protein